MSFAVTLASIGDVMQVGWHYVIRTLRRIMTARSGRWTDHVMREGGSCQCRELEGEFLRLFRCGVGFLTDG